MNEKWKNRIWNNEVALKIFYHLKLREQSFSELCSNIHYDKIETSKYVAQMEISGIIVGYWKQRESDGMWHRVYRIDYHNEWARLMDKILAPKQRGIGEKDV